MLSSELVFPSVCLAEPDGLLAVGGDLSVERLLLAYREGIFPWYSQDTPILWWSPEPRFVLLPGKLKVSKSMRRVLRSGRFSVTFDSAFREVIGLCKDVPRPGQPDTWITQDMLDAYHRLHQAGHAHSVEVWRDGQLAGGLYGVSLGRCFFGESMFSRESNTSKCGFITLVHALAAHGFSLIDCQVPTPHLASLGAEDMARDAFLALLREALAQPGLQGSWQDRLLSET